MVEIRNPISKSERFLRPFVFTTLGRAVGYNIARGAERVKLFEIGHAFRTAAGSVCQEYRSMALAAAGRKFPLDWSSVDSPAYDFFDLKGDVEDVVERAAGRRPGFMPGARTFLHPGRQAEIVDSEGRPFGFCGELHPQVAETWGLYGRLYVAEWDLEGVGTPPEIVSVSVPRAPAVQRDLALVVPGGVPSAAVVAAVRSVGLEHLADIEVFDRYVGTQVEPGHYSLGVRLTFQTDRTLMDEEVDREIERLVSRLADDHCFRLR